MTPKQEDLLAQLANIIRIAVNAGIESERERCAEIAEHQGKIPDYTEIQRAHIYCANAIAAAIRKPPPRAEGVPSGHEN